MICQVISIEPCKIINFGSVNFNLAIGSLPKNYVSWGNVSSPLYSKVEFKFFYPSSPRLKSIIGKQSSQQHFVSGNFKSCFIARM